MRRAGPDRLIFSLFLISLFLCSSAVFSQSEVSGADFPGTWSFRNDWSSGTLQWELVLPLSGERAILPSTRMEMEKEIDRHFPSLFLEALLPLTIDSSTTLLSRIEKTPGLRGDLVALANTAKRTYSHYTPDFSSWRCSFELALYPDIVDFFITHETPFLPDRRISTEPTASYTGILIYVEEELPLHGMFSSSRLKRALFPRIMDEEMNIVMDPSMVRPEIISRSGTVLYLPPERMDESESRVGHTPLRISARALFGKNRTDLVIPDEAAQQILSSIHNINLIRDGRIAVIAAEH